MLVLVPVLVLALVLNRAPAVLAVEIAGRRLGPVLSRFVILVLEAIVLFPFRFFCVFSGLLESCRGLFAVLWMEPARGGVMSLHVTSLAVL